MNQQNYQELKLHNEELEIRNKALSISEIRYRRLFETAQDGILILDIETARITDANPFIGNLLGFSSKELLGKELWEIGFFKDKESSKAAMRQLQVVSYIRYEDLPLETKAGQPIDVEFVSNVYRENGHHVIQCNIRNITARKAAETEQISNRGRLEQALLSKDEFISIASHELKTPITTIKGYLEILTKFLRDQNQPHTLNYLSKMDYQISRLTSLINELLDVSRIQAGKLQLDKEVVLIEKIVKDVIEDMQYSTDSHKIIFQNNVGSQRVLADKYRLTQVLINLISNAIKYSPKSNKVIVKISTDKNIVVSVEDFGIGISNRDQVKVFDRFFQAKTHIRKSAFGLGLGLYISSEIISAHGGKIWIESIKGVGSSPLLFLMNKHSLRSKELKKILVVDDDQGIADVMGIMLDNAGYKVNISSSGKGIQKKVLKYLPDLILLDIWMPGIDGKQVLKLLKTNDKTKHIPIIIISALNNTKEIAKTVGADDFITKPFEMDHFLLKIKAHLA